MATVKEMFYRNRLTGYLVARLAIFKLMLFVVDINC